MSTVTPPKLSEIRKRLSEDDHAYADWWIVETKHAYFIYEDEPTARKEAASQAAAYGYAEVFHARSDYDLLIFERTHLLATVEKTSYHLENILSWVEAADLEWSTNFKKAIELARQALQEIEE